LPLLATLAAFCFLSVPSAAKQDIAPRITPLAEPVKNQIVLIPIDSRPAAGQFAQMIGAMAGVEVLVPPIETLGRFTTPGNVSKIYDWLKTRDLSRVSSIVASADMLAYGGLIASRVSEVDSLTAQARLRRLINFKQQIPSDIKLYIFASTMRLAPTATIQAAPYRMQLAKYEEMKDRYERTGDKSLPPRMANAKKAIPPFEIIRYERTRNRNHEVQKSLIRMCSGPEVEYLIMGQDDAKPDGPHIQENTRLRQLVKTYSLQKKIFFCEGIDQHSNILISRAILKQKGFTPKVKVVYSDEDGKNQFALYESKTVKESLDDQLSASGAVPATSDEFDYTLYLNTPKRKPEPFSAFLQNLVTDIDQGFPVAVADINFGVNGTSDEELSNALVENGRAMRLLSFAGWNTAGNTMGTAIPAANVYLFARKYDTDPLIREIAKREFVLHRFADDFAYHKYTRPGAYKLIDSLQSQRDEVYGTKFESVNNFVRRDLTARLEGIFKDQFLDQTFFADTKEYKMTAMSNVKVLLPWPRAYEARIEFKLNAEPVESSK
jgi:hypothetical protein